MQRSDDIIVGRVAESGQTQTQNSNPANGPASTVQRPPHTSTYPANTYPVPQIQNPNPSYYPSASTYPANIAPNGYATYSAQQIQNPNPSYASASTYPVNTGRYPTYTYPDTAASGYSVSHIYMPPVAGTGGYGPATYPQPHNVQFDPSDKAESTVQRPPRTADLESKSPCWMAIEAMLVSQPLDKLII